MDPLLIMFMYEMNSFERPISQPLKVRNELGHWIFIVRYWIFSSKLLNLTAMTFARFRSLWQRFQARSF